MPFAIFTNFGVISSIPGAELDLILAIKGGHRYFKSKSVPVLDTCP